jgi:ATP-binding cassette subfamily B protein
MDNILIKYFLYSTIYDTIISYLFIANNINSTNIFCFTIGGIFLFKLIRFLKPYKKQVILGPAFKLLEAILELLIPLLMALLIDNGVKTHNLSYVLKIGGFMLLTAIIGAASAFVCQYYASIASQGVGTVIRNDLFKKIETFSFIEIDKFGTSSLINRLTSDVNQLQLAVAMLIRLVVRVPFLCIGGIIMVMFINLKLSIILLIIMPLFAIILYLIMSKSIPLYKNVQQRLDKLSIVVRENLSGVRVIRAFAKVNSERLRFSKANKDYADNAINVGKISALLNPATTVIINFGIAAVLWFGGIEVNIGNMSQGEVIAFINYINTILSALIILANLVILFTKAAASASRVNEVFSMEPSIVDEKSFAEALPLNIDSSVVAIEFKNVSFSYNKSSEYALKNITFKINRGETIGIIGSTGSGKTTLISLIARLYDTTEGSVTVNGIDVKNQAQNSLRNIIGMVPQKAVLFKGTVSENIRWGKEFASEDEIKEAAKIAQADKFINNLPKGYDTIISQGGSNLSGGQKQRLTIARALVRKPEILILDDSSSALDYATDTALRKKLKESTDNMTVIMITQRVSTIKNSDLIIVLDEGEIVGIGKNDILMETCDVYREIYNSQLESEVN